jgi:hypothetical protein
MLSSRLIPLVLVATLSACGASADSAASTPPVLPLASAQIGRVHAFSHGAAEPQSLVVEYRTSYPQADSARLRRAVEAALATGAPPLVVRQRVGNGAAGSAASSASPRSVVIRPCYADAPCRPLDGVAAEVRQPRDLLVVGRADGRWMLWQN